MRPLRSHVIGSIGLLVIVGVATGGCPKRPAVQVPPPAVAATPGAGGDAGGGVSPTTSGPGAGVAGTQPGAGAGTGTQPGGAGSSSAVSPGGAGGQGSESAALPGGGATGTTIPALPSPSEFIETTALKDIHFDFDKSDIRPPDRAILDQNVAWLKMNANATVLIEGHCDERGTSEYNVALGERRASATREYLTSAGVAASRITTVTYGKERPQCAEHTEECWAQNRRAHFLAKP
jgi:peptidoglycan-associated lipoprotein